MTTAPALAVVLREGDARCKAKRGREGEENAHYETRAESFPVGSECKLEGPAARAGPRSTSEMNGVS